MLGERSVYYSRILQWGPGAEMIIKMLDKVQPVRPVELSRQQQAANVNAAQPFDATNNVQDPPPRLQDGSSEETALDVLDSEDELVNDMRLDQGQEQRLRRQLSIWRERGSSSSDSSQ